MTRERDNSSATIAGYVLAGGESTRFGKDKALADVSGKPMLVRMCELLRSVVNEVTVIADPEKYAGLGFRCVADCWPAAGPLGGIITALEDAGARNESPEWNLIVSCDMPFLTREWLAHLAGRALKSSSQVALPESAHGPEPLCACYRTDAAPALRAAFERRIRKITDALKQVTTEVLDEAHWKRFDSAGRLFWNMNTLTDYEEARRILEAEQK
ncbi:MAG: molybdenum cofactor guanylyltransferase [Candidatus Acidiferrales bacterium]